MDTTTNQDTKWAASDLKDAEYLGVAEFMRDEFDGHLRKCVSFELLVTDRRVVFGSHTNNVFLESGYILRDESETLDKTLQELAADIDCYYTDGGQYCSRIVFNERM